MIKQGHIQEESDRTGSPFAAVIADYKRRAKKVTERRAKKQPGVVATKNDLRAAAYYLGTAERLEAL